MKTCTERFNLVDPILKRFFRWLGARIGERPGYFLIVPVFITLLAVTGFQRIHTESRPEKLFALKSGRAQQALNLVQQLFPINDTAFDYTRRHDLNNLIRIQISSKDGGSLLTSKALAEVAQLDDLVRNTVLVTDVKGEWRYEDLCASWEGKCEQNEAMRLTPMASDLEAGLVNLSYPVHLVDIWSDVPAILLPKTLGSPVVNNDSVVVSAPALALSYYTGRYVYYGVDVSRQWENEVLKRLLAIQPNLNHTIISFYLSQTLGEELDHNVYSVIPYMSVNYVLMGTFCVLACLMRDWVRGKPVVVLSGLLGAAMAVGTAFGILMYAGVPFIGINIAAPFLMLGIGVDDTFVVLSAWWRTRLHDPVPKRMAEAYEEAAVSITITSLTDMFSFWVGVATPIPSVQIFCLYTGLSVVFTYLWHIFFFGACLALSGYAEQKNLHSVTFQPIPTRSEAAHRSRLYRLLCTGGVSKSEPWRETDVGEHGAMLFFKNTFARALNMPKVKALVVLSFAAYLAGAVYGCLHVQEGLDKRRLARQDSYSHHFFADQAKYFADLPYRVQIIIDGQHNYWEPEVQQKVDTLLKTFENSTYVTGSLYTDCWLREWVNFIENSRGILNVNVSTPEAWVKSLKEMLLANTDRRFKLDVVFDNETGNNIIASRCLVQTHDVRGVTEDAVMMEELRSICDNSPIKCEVFEPHFIFFDQYTYVRTITIQSTVVATIIMCIISLIFIPNPICSLWVALSIMSIEIGVIGYMSLWGVNLDSISMINLIMCIGFSVDFSAHISYAYMSAHGLSADRRVEESLYCLGLPIIQGAFSTIIGVSTLILAPSYIFEVFFKTTFLVIFFGMMHGLILLPVMLSIFGPGSLLCGAHGGHKEEDAEGAVGAAQTPSYLTPAPLIMEKPEAAPEIVAVAVNVTAEINSSPGVTVSPSSPTSPSKPSAPTLTCGVTEAQRLSLALELSGDDTSSVGSAPTIPRARLVRRRSRCASAPKDTYSNAGYCSDSEGTSVSGSGSAAGGTDTGFSDATEEKSCVE